MGSDSSFVSAAAYRDASGAETHSRSSYVRAVRVLQIKASMTVGGVDVRDSYP